MVRTDDVTIVVNTVALPVNSKLIQMCIALAEDDLRCVGIMLLLHTKSQRHIIGLIWRIHA